MWLSKFLSVSGQSFCSHEACEFAGSAKEFWENADIFRPSEDQHYGNSDSANIFVLPALLAERPMTRVVFINRHIVEVCKSMKAIGYPVDEKAAQLMLTLRDCYHEYFDLVINYHDLGREDIEQYLWEFVLPDVPFDRLRFRKYNLKKIGYSKEFPMPKKDTSRFVAWVNQELSCKVEK